MKVLHVLASASKAWGGPPRLVRDLTGALVKLGVDNTVVSLGDRKSPSIGFPEKVRVWVNEEALIPRLGLPSTTDFGRILLRETKDTDIVHIHEIWHFPQALSALLSHMADVPHLVTLHGELKPWPLGRHKILKEFAWHFYQRRILEAASGLHALTDDERTSIEQAGISTPVRVIPNGVDTSRIEEALELETGSNSGGIHFPTPYVLYVGRIAAGKGLETLIDAFADFCDALPTLSLVIAGPDHEGLWNTLKARALRLGISERVIYAGFIDEPMKFQCMAGATLFVLPSISEGLSISMIEALACGTPVIITPGCNVPEVEQAGAGRVVLPIPTLLSREMFTVIRDQNMVAAMRGKARQLARSRFSIESTARNLLQFYQDLES